MKRSILVTASLLACVSALAGCAKENPAVNRVGVNVVDKSLFTGSWYFSRVVIDVDYEAAGLGTYPGDAAIDFGQLESFGAMPRVRWVIDEDHLLAYRDYELVEGINPEGEGEGEDFVGHPVAAFAIDSHFDIIRDYNPVTREERNVLVENDTDNLWFERQYMRVDWSKNLLTGYYGQIHNLYEIIGLYNREPSDLFIQGQSDFPDSWQPQFDFMACAGLDDTSEGCSRGERDWAPDYDQGEFYHFSFVTQELLSPGLVPDPFTGGMTNWCTSVYSDAPLCTSHAVYVRNAFLKVSDAHEYEPVNYVDERFNRHGMFRLERETFDRSSAPEDPAFRTTEFLNYAANRQNIWYDWVEDDGTPTPYAARRVRKNVWYSTPELPAHLVEASFDMVSRWNEVFMRLVRLQRGQPLPEFGRVDCQESDPDGYCYCTRDPEDGTILNPTCEGGYDPFTPPAETGVANAYDCHVSVPADAQPILDRADLNDSHFYGWYGAEMVGSECVVELRMNTCNRASIEANGGTTEGMRCEERGDLRYKFLSYVDQPGTAFLGVATLRGDPVTGEIITGDANIGGPALDGYRTFALQTYDLINGDIDDRTFLIGEDVREYLENLDRVQQPAPPREDFSVANRLGSPTDGLFSEELTNRMGAFVERAERLRGEEGAGNVFSFDRRSALVGSDIEHRLFSNWDALAGADIEWVPNGVGPSDVNDAILDRVSPFRRSAGDMLQDVRERDNALSKANVMVPNEYVDASVLEFVNRHRDWPRARLEIVLNQLLYYQTQLHEMGHCLGLRHQFGASADVGNYDDDYYYIDERFPYPDPGDFETDGTPGLNPTEQRAWEDAYNGTRERRELAGIDRWMNSSIMEYTGQWYERAVTGARGAGRYDHAAVTFAYADMVEIYDNRATSTPLDEINPVNTGRMWVRYYQGGETCNTDAECPYSTAGARAAELAEGNTASGLTQSCVPHPRNPAIGGVCSNFDDDSAALLEGAADDAVLSFVPVEYRFCTDDRADTIAWCHRFDEGDNYREIVQNIWEDYERNYIFRNFRRYRRSFSVNTPLSRLISRQYNVLQSVFADLLYQYQANPEYREQEGPFGFTDHFLATADVLNLYGRVLTNPGIGSYRWDEGWERYIRRNVDPDTPGAQLSIPLGMGRYTFSEYQAGLTGIYRIELVGSFYEKWITMQLMTQRGGYAPYTRDVPYWVSLYDLFPVEMQTIYQGMILNQPEVIAPRLECGGGTFPRCADPRVFYADFYRGDCTDPATCRPSAEERFGEMPVLDPGSVNTLQFLAAVFALSEIPVFWDTSFQNQVFVCIQGEGSCPDIAPGEVEGEDYVTYAADRYGKTFIAWQVEPTSTLPNQTSMGYAMVEETRDLNIILEALRQYQGYYGGDPLDIDNVDPATLERLEELEYEIPEGTVEEIDEEIDRIQSRIQSNESFFFQLIQLQRQFGI